MRRRYGAPASCPRIHRSDRARGCVSIIIRCYNAEAFLRDALNSALRQTWSATEVIAVDDGSTDGTAEVLEEYRARIRIVRQENRGVSAAANSGLRASRGEYLCFLDADDYLSESFAQEMAQALIRCQATLAYCGWQNVGSRDRSNEPFLPPDYDAVGRAEAFLRSASPWPIHAAMFRADVLSETGGFDEALPTCEDYDFWLRIAATRPIVRVDKVMAYYRHHGQGQITANRWRQAYFVWLVKRRFIERFPEVVGAIPAKRLRELIDGALHRRGFDAFWRRDLVAAQRIFRMLLRIGFWSPKDLKYLLPALLPEKAFRRLVAAADRAGPGTH